MLLELIAFVVVLTAEVRSDDTSFCCIPLGEVSDTMLNGLLVVVVVVLDDGDAGDKDKDDDEDEDEDDEDEYGDTDMT